MEEPGPKKQCTSKDDLSAPSLLLAGDQPSKAAPTATPEPPTSSMETMTSRDYYFDSYSHFGKVWLFAH